MTIFFITILIDFYGTSIKMKPLLDPHRGQLQVERVRAAQVGGRHQQDHRDQLGPAGLEVGTSLSRKR